ncbi:CBF/Mak21 family-domain-containing protein [Hyaloraphidium curvatum]|nr:CBF/Mak21 family-domain-containing protein [Hyaloraphidium curvatum]
MPAEKKRKRADKAATTDDSDALQSVSEGASGQLAEIAGAVAVCVLKESSAEEKFNSVVTLERLFAKLIRKRKLVPSGAAPAKQATDEAASRLQAWLKDHYRRFQKALLALLSDPEPSVQVAALKALMELLKAESDLATATDAGPSRFDNDAYLRITTAVLESPNMNHHLMDCLLGFIRDYDDVRYYTYHNIEHLARSKLDSGAAEEGLQDAIFAVLTGIDSPVPAKAADIGSFFALSHQDKPAKTVTDPSHHRKAFSQAWLAFLRLPLDAAAHKKVLLVLDRVVIPNLVDPNLLLDYLTQAVDGGGVLAVLALNGLFTLIHKHNLDYPDFYKKLYNLLDDNVMHVKYRARFLRLVDLFLSSTHLPSYLAAAFVKRMARLLLSAPPQAIIAVIPLLYNLMRRHPSCTVLIHRGSTAAAETGGKDPYDHLERDPANCNALQSSLWEMATLESHYFHAVSALAKLFRDRLDKPEYPLDSFLDTSSASLLATELGRPIKRAVPMSFEFPAKLFDGDAWGDWDL